jgi:hypothetical protein
MMYEITLQNVLSTVQTLAILVGIAYYVMVLNYTRRNQEQTLKTREVTFLHQTLGSFISTPIGVKYANLVYTTPISSFEEWLELVETNPEFDQAWTWFANTLDLIGIYLKEGVLDIRMIAQYQPALSLLFWKWYKPIIKEARKKRVHIGPSWFQNVDYLFNSLEKYFEENPELAPIS